MQMLVDVGGEMKRLGNDRVGRVLMRTRWWQDERAVDEGY